MEVVEIGQRRILVKESPNVGEEILRLISDLDGVSSLVGLLRSETERRSCRQQGWKEKDLLDQGKLKESSDLLGDLERGRAREGLEEVLQVDAGGNGLLQGSQAEG